MFSENMLKFCTAVGDQGLIMSNNTLFMVEFLKYLIYSDLYVDIRNYIKVYRDAK